MRALKMSFLHRNVAAICAAFKLLPRAVTPEILKNFVGFDPARLFNG
jgi:hypothetical protein